MDNSLNMQKYKVGKVRIYSLPSKQTLPYCAISTLVNLSLWRAGAVEACRKKNLGFKDWRAFTSKTSTCTWLYKNREVADVVNHHVLAYKRIRRIKVVPSESCCGTQKKAKFCNALQCLRWVCCRLSDCYFGHVFYAWGNKQAQWRSILMQN